MAIASELTVQRFLNVQAATPVVCNWSLFVKAEVHVYYGKARLEAVQNVDYTVTLNAPTYSSFTITPLTSLLTKINALIALDATEINYIEVRRELDMLTAITSAIARSSESVAREFDRVAQRFSQVKEQLGRVFKLPITALNYDLTLPEWEANKALTWDPVLKKLINSTQNVNASPTAEAVAAAAAAAVSAADAAADAASAAADAALADADRIAAQAAAASIIPLPAGGTAGQILEKVSAANGDATWVTPAATDVGAALAGATEDVTPADNDTFAGNLAAGTLTKWTAANIRAWVITFMETYTVRTGQVSFFDLTAAPTGWVKRNGGSIGNAASGATTRANADTAALFAVYWGFNATDCPIQDSTGAASVRGADAATDFAANKRIVMPETRGRFLRGWDDGLGLDSGRRIGSDQTEMVGSHTHPLAMNAVPAHAHVMYMRARRGANGNNYPRGWDGGDVDLGGNDGYWTDSQGGHTPSGTATANSGTENRPRNSASLVCVKL